MMVDSIWIICAALIALAFGYPLWMRVNLERVRPARVRLVELGGEMLESPKYTKEQKILITDLLEEALDWRFMAKSAMSLPRLIVKILVRGMPSDPELDAMTKDDKFRELVDLHFRSASAANPICAFVVRTELALGMLFIVSALVAPYLIAKLAALVAPEVRRPLRVRVTG
jgi:hypothetical protein